MGGLLGECPYAEWAVSGGPVINKSPPSFTWTAMTKWLADNLALRQGLLELFDASVGNLGAIEEQIG